MAVADASSASGAIATSPARRARAVRGLSLTTPAQFRLAAAVLVVGLAVLGLVGVQVALDRADAVTAVADDATPMLVGAEELYVALADADAAASSAFLHALEPPDLRARYRVRIAEANALLTRIAAEPDLSPESRAAITRIAEALPAYTGRIEAARANDRWGFPVGAAHLRQASDDMVATILPAATSVYDDAARQLYDAYGNGTSRAHPHALVAVGAAVLALLLATQVVVTWRTRRLLNVGLLGATVLVGALGAWTLVRIDWQGSALVRSQREGSDQLIVLSRARILALRSLSDDNLRLIERGTDTSYLDEDFAAVTTGSAGPTAQGGCSAPRQGWPSAPDPRPRSSASASTGPTTWRSTPRSERSTMPGSTGPLSTSPSRTEADAHLLVDQGLASEITLAEARLRSNAADANRHLTLAGGNGRRHRAGGRGSSW